ncbi:MAG TPA: S8 family serine peptidase, partial [Solirubrobacterales bacterium]
VAGSGWVDFWTVSSLGNAGAIASFTTHVDEEETLGIPATADEALAVGAYVTDACWDSIDGSSYSYSPMPSLGDIASFSSRGPTRDGRAKPEVAAPGMGIVSSLAQEVKAAVDDEWETDTWHQLMQGTSQAAPHVAGAIALFFEDDPTLDTGDVESLLKNHAREDDWTQLHETGTLIGLKKNRAFGSGKLNVGSWAFADPFETNDSQRTAREVLSGEDIAGYLDHAADLDIFELEAIAVGDTVKIDLTGLADNYKLNLLRSVPLGGCFSPAFSVTASSDNAGTADETITHTTTLFSLARFFRVLSSAGGFSATTPYSLTAVITRPETAAVHNTTATAQVLPTHNEFKVSGSIAVLGQQDYYKLTAKGGQTITARAGATRTVQILNSAGVVLATSFGGTANYAVSPFALGTGTYYVVVSGGAVGNYTLTTTVD